MWNQRALALFAAIYQPCTRDESGQMLCSASQILVFYARILKEISEGLEDSFYEDAPNHLQQSIITLLKDTSKQLPGFFDRGQR